ncbi:hypothetical protein [Xenorhabdus bovienii]|uniref:hypothetical protein n=1 Tax=Xenorhabdus bovienii TaxID=40576 RepID=UPI0023B2A1D2|nr:hypothetical protein [Xenorhabdus bovienii]MDE9465092.1 hypothetical protein [Xenorhabdus bovienii]
MILALLISVNDYFFGFDEVNGRDELIFIGNHNSSNLITINPNSYGENSKDYIGLLPT